MHLTKTSVVRGHHVYKTVWTPSVDEKLTVKAEDGNDHYKHAVAVIKEDTVVGHVPREFSRISWYFLQRGGFISVEIIRKRMFGKGLEVPCTYTFTGPKKIVEKLQKLLPDVHN